MTTQLLNLSPLLVSITITFRGRLNCLHSKYIQRDKRYKLYINCSIFIHSNLIVLQLSSPRSIGFVNPGHTYNSYILSAACGYIMNAFIREREFSR